MKITKKSLEQLALLSQGGMYHNGYSQLLQMKLIKTEQLSMLRHWAKPTKLGKQILKAADKAALKAANDEFSCYLRNFS